MRPSKSFASVWLHARARLGAPVGFRAPAGTVASTAWKGFMKRAGDRQRGVVGQLVRARVAYESLD